MAILRRFIFGFYLLFLSTSVYAQFLMHSTTGVNIDQRVSQQEALEFRNPNERNLKRYKTLMELYYEKALVYKQVYELAVDQSALFYRLLREKQRIYLSPQYYYLLGKVLFDQNKTQEAADAFIEYIRSKPKKYMVEARFYLAACWWQMGKTHAADSLWQGTSPTSNSTKFELAYIYSRLHIRKSNVIALLANKRNTEIPHNLVYAKMFLEDFNFVRQNLPLINCTVPFFTENSKDSLRTTRYFDPSVYFTIYTASLYLSYFYANMYNTFASEQEKISARTNFYRGYYFYCQRLYDKCVQSTSGFGDPESRLLNAAAKAGQTGVGNSLADWIALQSPANITSKILVACYYHWLHLPDEYQYCKPVYAQALAILEEKSLDLDYEATLNFLVAYAKSLPNDVSWPKLMDTAFPNEEYFKDNVVTEILFTRIMILGKFANLIQQATFRMNNIKKAGVAIDGLIEINNKLTLMMVI